MWRFTRQNGSGVNQKGNAETHQAKWKWSKPEDEWIHTEIYFLQKCKKQTGKCKPIRWRHISLFCYNEAAKEELEYEYIRSEWLEKSIHDTIWRK
jgi:hypothetical protein